MILAIDQGTTGTTCLVVDDELTIRGRGYHPVEQHFPRPGWVEHDPDDIWRSVTSSAEQALREASIRTSELTAIGITNQRETTVLWDRKTGRPAARAIVWQDRRTADACARLPAELIRERTGLVPDPYFSGTKIAWLLEHVDAPPERLAFGTVDSWLIWKLTGGDVHATDPTNASRTLLFGLQGMAWEDELLDQVGVPRSLLPEIVPSSGVAGMGELLGGRVPVAGIAGDQQAALFGQCCFEPGEAKATYGTGTFLLVNDGERVDGPPHGLVRTAAAQPGTTALEGSVFVSGAALQWLRDGLGILAESGQSEHLARSVESAGGVHFVPALAGLGSPQWRPDVRGVISGITGGTGRAHLVRAALEAIAFQVRDVVEALPGGLATLRADGGATANGWLMQFQADLLGMPVEVAAERETTAIGAAALAGLATGVWHDGAAVAAARMPATVVEPRMSRDEAEELYDGWTAALRRAMG